jgi:hypothetical protein
MQDAAHVCAGSHWMAGERVLSQPIAGIAFCWTRAASGHATARLPARAMNSRDHLVTSSASDCGRALFGGCCLNRPSLRHLESGITPASRIAARGTFPKRQRRGRAAAAHYSNRAALAGPHLHWHLAVRLGERLLWVSPRSLWPLGRINSGGSAARRRKASP